MIHHVDSFTDTAFSGNPCVCVTGAEALTNEERVKIARETNMPETVFLLARSTADWIVIHLQFLTPTGDEIPFCGHGTIGMVTSLLQEKPDLVHVLVRTKTGEIPVRVVRDADGHSICMDAPPSVFKDRVRLVDLVDGLGANSGQILVQYPAFMEDTTKYVYFAVRTLDDLIDFQIDFHKATSFGKKIDCGQYCAILVLPNGGIQMRGFSPQVGVNEDPFTGSALAGAVNYCIRTGLLSNLKVGSLLKVYQGAEMGRPGTAVVRILTLDPVTVRISAHSVYLGSGNLSF